MCPNPPVKLKGLAYNIPGKPTQHGNKGGTQWRPSVSMRATGQGLALTLEGSHRFPNAIIVHLPGDKNSIIGRVEGTASSVLAPFMRRGQVTCAAWFDFGNFNLDSFTMAINLFADESDVVELAEAFSRFVQDSLPLLSPKRH